MNQNEHDSNSKYNNGKIYINNDFLRKNVIGNHKVYINEHFKGSKVLVNPNFSRNVYINPNFKATATIKPSVYVNPSILQHEVKNNSQSTPKLSNIVPNLKNELIQSRFNYQKTNLTITNPVDVNTPKINNNIINTKYKLVRNEANDNKKKMIKLGNHKLVRRSLLSSKTKYETKNEFTPKILYSRYKIVKSTGNDSKRKTLQKTKNTLIKSQYKLITKAYLMQLKPQEEIIKKSRFKLIKRNPNVKYIRKCGIIYELNISKDTLRIVKMTSKRKRPERQINIKGDMYILKSNSTYIKANKSMYKKNNIACFAYNKTGQCMRHQRNKCNKKHDPDQISICTWFLQGECRNEKCLLSHKVSPEKMPTCKFFLDGLCRNDNCSYLHVKLSPKAPVCRAFLEGYCKNGIKCDKRHQLLCPAFEESGSCKKKDCRYPHGKAVRPSKDKLLIKIGRNSKTLKQEVKPIANKIDLKPIDIETSDSIRYYESDLVQNTNDKNVENINMESDFSNRPKIGFLPSFIPLND